MKTKSARDPGPSGARLTREERITLSLLRIAIDLTAIKKDLKKSDIERLPALTPLFEAADQLIVELGFADEE